MQSVRMEIEVKVKGNENSSGSIKVQENVSPICQPQPWESRFYHSAIYLMEILEKHGCSQFATKANISNQCSYPACLLWYEPWMKPECWENEKFQDAKPFTQEIWQIVS